MSLTRWAPRAAALTVLIAGCAPWAPSEPSMAIAPRSAPVQMAGDLVLVTTGDGLAALDWTQGRLVYRAPHAVMTSDRTRLVATSTRGEDGVLDILDLRTGARQASVSVPPRLTASVVSPDGRLAALASPETGTGASQPAGRTRSQIAIADLAGAVESRMLDLDGNDEPDAFSSDGQRLFVLDYQPPENPDRYRVRQVDLATGLVTGVLSRNKVLVPEEEMRGRRGTHILSSDRSTLYTLYTHQPDHLHSRDLAAGLTSTRGDVHAFVHVLNLAEGWAYCLDLPRPFGIGPADAHALALSPDGRWLYVADRSSGMLAVADTLQLQVRTVSSLGADWADGQPAAAEVGPDDTLYLVGTSEVLAVDARTLAVERRLPVPGEARGLGVSADGRRLYVSLVDRVAALDLTAGAEIGSMTLAGAERLVVVAP